MSTTGRYPLLDGAKPGGWSTGAEAVDELAVALIEAAPADSALEVEVEYRQDEVRVTGRAEGAGVPPELSEVGTSLVAAGTTRYGLLAEEDTIAFRATFARTDSSHSRA